MCKKLHNTLKEVTVERSQSPVLGSIAIQVGDKKYSVNITGSEKFAYELNRAVLRGQDPAEALFFLAELGATLYHPDSPMLGREKARTYEQFFGAVTQGPSNPHALTLVK